MSFVTPPRPGHTRMSRSASASRARRSAAHNSESWVPPSAMHGPRQGSGLPKQAAQEAFHPIPCNQTQTAMYSKCMEIWNMHDPPKEDNTDCEQQKAVVVTRKTRKNTGHISIINLNTESRSRSSSCRICAQHIPEGPLNKWMCIGGRDEKVSQTTCVERIGTDMVERWNTQVPPGQNDSTSKTQTRSSPRVAFLEPGSVNRNVNVVRMDVLSLSSWGDAVDGTRTSSCRKNWRE